MPHSPLSQANFTDEFFPSIFLFFPYPYAAWAGINHAAGLSCDFWVNVFPCR
ncbi:MULTISPECIES: hypothetical protein [unclassified Synechocystis]|uniref:hypothetical protein n=1 Tax=unclassified Synechocystis TaxID=2640012 RepID=UPI0002EDF233|nr:MULTISPECIES: hypothetical protein [unclassified Synechocystis]UOO12909.1 hypothetical protein MT986_06455 [Synechocystis sp. PCC 6803]